MAYDKLVPPAPVTPTMLPLATELDVRDVGVIVQPYKTDGKKTKRTTLGDLAGFINSLAGENWKTFTIGANNRIALGDYQRNVIIVPSAKDQSVTLDHFPSNGIIIYAPDWDSASESTFVTIDDSNWSTSIIKGGVGILYCFGTEIPIIARTLISSGIDSLAWLKQLSVDKLIVESELTLPALSVLSEYIATGAITTDKIATGAVTIDKIGNGAVTPEKISTGAVTADKINTGAVTADKIGNGAVTIDKIGNRAVTSGKIALSGVHEENIDTGAVTAGKIATDAVETSKIKNKAVTSEKLADQLAFVNRPILPPNNFYSQEVETNGADYVIITSSGGIQYKGTIFHAADPFPLWGIKLHITDADPNASNGLIYRIYNNTLNEANINDFTTGTLYTRIPAWSFKDFYHLDGWRMD